MEGGIAKEDVSLVFALTDLQIARFMCYEGIHRAGKDGHCRTSAEFTGLYRRKTIYASMVERAGEGSAL